MSNTTEIKAVRREFNAMNKGTLLEATVRIFKEKEAALAFKCVAEKEVLDLNGNLEKLKTKISIFRSEAKELKHVIDIFENGRQSLSIQIDNVKYQITEDRSTVTTGSDGIRERCEPRESDWRGMMNKLMGSIEVFTEINAPKLQGSTVNAYFGSPQEAPKHY